MSRKWYTADFHLFHDNIIRYCNRPFDNIWQMHDAIVEGMNSVVKQNDLLYILGDVSFYGGEKVQKVLRKINGRKHLIIGNHDAKNMGKWEGWDSVNHYLELKDRGQNIVLCHYPIESWNKRAHGAIHLHGHCHGVKGNKGVFNSNFLREDVGVDPFDFKPVDLDILTTKWLAEGKLV